MAFLESMSFHVNNTKRKKYICTTVQKTLNVIKSAHQKKMLAGMKIFKIRYHTTEVTQK
jgi:hypothetical protein